jgi:hypothetical protein
VVQLFLLVVAVPPHSFNNNHRRQLRPFLYQVVEHIAIACATIPQADAQLKIKNQTWNKKLKKEQNKR